MIRTIAPMKLKGRVVDTLSATGNDFTSLSVEELKVDFTGIIGDIHAGFTRYSNAREPWYPRGTEMRNERQLSILSAEELDEIGLAMKLDVVEAGWIGANLVLEGIPNLSYLPPRSLMFFEGGVTLRIDGYNSPCTVAGAAIARASGQTKNRDIALEFVKAAHMKRGLVAWVEKEGQIKAGEAVSVRIWEQWLYQ